MVTMKWTIDDQGRPVSAWMTEAPTTAQVREFGAHYHKAVRLTAPSRVASRRFLRAQAATAVAK